MIGLVQRYRRVFAVIVAGVGGFLLTIIPALFGQMPQPNYHDEYGYLLQADTFAHGRLTNPPHKFWQHFETFHVIQHPTYTAKFPPGQGLALAVGQVIGNPLIGAYLSVGIACAALSWMLLAVVPPLWALLGCLTILSIPEIYGWGQQYAGGAVAMIGGAFVGGAVLRAVRIALSPRWGVIAAIGFSMLAFTRPFEGLLFAAITLAIAAFSFWRADQLAAACRRMLPALVMAFIPALLFLGYYNWRVTGNPLRLPYRVYQDQYMIAPLMFWQKPTPDRVYHNDAMARFHNKTELEEYEHQTSLRGYLLGVWNKARYLLRIFISPWTMLVPVVAGLSMLRASRFARWSLIVVLGLPILHMLCTPWMRPQYMAPAVGFLALLCALGLARLSTLQLNRRPVGRVVVVVFFVAHIAWTSVFAVRYFRAQKSSYGASQAAVIKLLKQNAPDKKILLLVQYENNHNPLSEIVFNRADIDASDVVIARDLGAEKDWALMDYYPDRAVYLLNPDKKILEAVPR